MLILSIDTTTRAGSVAVVRGTSVLYQAAGDPARTFGERLPLDVERALAAAGVRLPEIELFAVAAGPGSFTGLRIGIATVQGLAMAADRRVVALSALDAAARSAGAEQGRVAAWKDAQRGEVYGALYGHTGRDVLIPAVSGTPEGLLDAWGTADNLADVRFVGDGAARYRDVIAARLGNAVAVSDAPLLAGTLGQMAAEAPERAVSPHAIVPIYVRRSDAELARARRQAAG